MTELVREPTPEMTLKEFEAHLQKALLDMLTIEPVVPSSDRAWGLLRDAFLKAWEALPPDDPRKLVRFSAAPEHGPYALRVSGPQLAVKKFFDPAAFRHARPHVVIEIDVEK